MLINRRAVKNLIKEQNLRIEKNALQSIDKVLNDFLLGICLEVGKKETSKKKKKIEVSDVIVKLRMVAI